MENTISLLAGIALWLLGFLMGRLSSPRQQITLDPRPLTPREVDAYTASIRGVEQ